ncbi:MAG: hypothetical protein JWN72_1375 [Thermoleophilia bacterium]|nr:hypothetical protein [Thermoleophilia bacterium]
MTHPGPVALRALLVVVIAIVVAGCGGDASPAGTTASGDGGVSLTHVDGTLEVTGDDLTVTPAKGSAVTLAVGPAVGKGELQALAASGAKARVFYAEQGDPIAAKVEAAPSAGDGAKTVDGVITKVSTSSITIQTSEGDARTFGIEPIDRSAFDTEHLQEHEVEGSPVRIYYRAEGGVEHAVAYEDA